MDAKRNLARQLALAQRMVAPPEEPDLGYQPFEDARRDEDCHELAELVLALDEWRREGGADPYAEGAPDA